MSYSSGGKNTSCLMTGTRVSKVSSKAQNKKRFEDSPSPSHKYIEPERSPPTPHHLTTFEVNGQY